MPRIDKVLICPYFGDLPPWWYAYEEQFSLLRTSGYDILLDFDLLFFRERVRTKLGVDCPIEYNSSKIHDYRAVFGVLYEKEIERYAWYGHTDFDCAYGRIEHFVTPATLNRCAVYTDCQYDYLAGPFTIYRNNPEVVRLYERHPEWRQILESPTISAWVEKDFAEIVKDAVPTVIENHHGFDRPELLERHGDGSLWHDEKEISFFHFNRTKEWPSVLA